MSLSQIMYILWRRGWIVALAFVVALIVASGVLLFVPGRYDATATASIDPGTADPVTAAVGGGRDIGFMQGNLIELVQSQRVALDVVRRLNLTASPIAQQDYRNSDSFGRQSIDQWMAASILKGVAAQFDMGTNVLNIKYKASDPQQAAQVANAFLASTIDASIAMKAASGDQTARWFAPQLDDLRKELRAARAALEQFQSRTNVVALNGGGGGDTETTALASVTQDLASNRALLTALQTRLASGSTDLASDPSDPDLQMINTLKDKISNIEAEIDAGKNSLGMNNPKMVSVVSNLANLRKQLADNSDKLKDRLRDRIAVTQNQIASLEVAQAQDQKTLIAAQAQRDRLGDLQRDLALKVDELTARERASAQALLQSKLTFANIDVLDKAVPPLAPAFPKPLVVLPVATAAGLALGVLLALLIEATDRRVRCPADLGVATSAPLLGVIQSSGRRKGLRGGSRRGGLLTAS